MKDKKQNKTGERFRDKEGRERERGRDGERSRQREPKTERQRKRSKQQEREKRTTEENLLFSSLSILVSPGFGPPCYSLVSTATGRAAPNLHIDLHPFCIIQQVRAYS